MADRGRVADSGRVAEASAARLYLVTPAELDPATFAGLLDRALATGAVACLRLDLGPAPEETWRRTADHLRPVAHAHDVALVIAEHHRLVEPLGLDGVHLAASRTPVRRLRRELGRERIIGVFAGTSKHIGMTVAEAGADYVSFGPVGETGELGDGSRAGDELFQWWAEMIEVPVVAEGGVTPADAARLAPWVDFIVPDRRLWDDPAGIEAALTRYREVLSG